MSTELFEEGGSLNIRRLGRGMHEASVSIPKDEYGMIGRECPCSDCSPAYYKIKLGTGLRGPQEVVYCPYCRKADSQSAFHTREQMAYALSQLRREAIAGVRRMATGALGLDAGGRRRIAGGLFSIEMSIDTPESQTPIRLVEEELQRDIRCPSCSLEHAVFGLATWCPDCGNDVFLEHVREEFNVVRKMLSAVPARRAELGARVAGKDTENALEDVVSIFEAVLKMITRRYLERAGLPRDAIDARMKAVGNAYQNVERASREFHKVTDEELFENGAREVLDSAFAKRHPHTHNLGIVDRQYLDRARSGELEGRDVRISATEVIRAIDFAEAVLTRACRICVGAASYAGSEVTGQSIHGSAS